MAATGLDGWVDITATLLSPSTSAGSNRKRIYSIAYGNASGNVTLPTSITIGGVTPTFEGGHALGATVSRSATCQVSMNEAQLAAMVGSTITITGGSFSRRIISTRSIQDSAQTASTNSGLYSSGAAAVTSGAVPSLTRVAGSFTVAVVHSILITNATMSNPARVTAFNSPSTQVSIGDSTDTARTVDASFTISSCPCAMDAVNYAPFPTATIDTINGSAFGAVNAGSTGNTFTCTPAFVPTSGTHGGKAISAIAGSSGAYTFTSAAYVDGATFPEPDTSQTFTLTDGTSTPTASSVQSSPDGMASVVLVSPNSADPTYPAYYFAMTAGDRLVYPTEGGNFSIGTDSGVSTTTAGTRVCWHWNHTTSVMTQLNITVNDAGEVTGATGLTSSGLTSSGLTRAGLTSAGL